MPIPINQSLHYIESVKVYNRRKQFLVEQGLILKKGHRIYKGICTYAFWVTKEDEWFSVDDAIQLYYPEQAESLPYPKREYPVGLPLIHQNIVAIEPMESPASLVFYQDWKPKE